MVFEATAGICAACEQEGAVATPCSNSVCQKRGFHFIPRVHVPRGDEVPDGRIGQMWDNYLLVEKLGDGGVGAVYRALQPPVMLEAALKVLSSDAPKPLIARFQDEAAALARLNHPNIVRLLHFSYRREEPFLVMELVPGGTTLGDVAAEGLTLDNLFSIIGELVDALEAAHLVDVVHRDVKPANIMLQAIPSNPTFVRLVDFGLAKFTEAGGSTRLAAGTPTYMAPEQMSRGQIGPWTDWYAVGVILFELLTGARPYPAESTVEVIKYKMQPGFRPTDATLAEHLPGRARAALARLLAHDAQERAQDGGEVRCLLEQIQSAMSEVAEPGFLFKTVVEDWNQPTSRPADLPRRTLRIPPPPVGALERADVEPHPRSDAPKSDPKNVEPEPDSTQASNPMVGAATSRSEPEQEDSRPPARPDAEAASTPMLQPEPPRDESRPPRRALGWAAVVLLPAGLGLLLWSGQAGEPKAGTRSATHGARLVDASTPTSLGRGAVAGSPSGAGTHVASDAHTSPDIADAGGSDTSARDAAALDGAFDASTPRMADGSASDSMTHRTAKPRRARASQSPRRSATTERSMESAREHLRRGRALIDQMKWEAGEKELLRAVSDLRVRGEAYRWLAEVRFQQKNRKDAQYYIEKALALDPDNGSYLDFKGRVLHRNGRLQRACAVWRLAFSARRPSLRARRYYSKWCTSADAAESGSQGDRTEEPASADRE